MSSRTLRAARLPVVAVAFVTALVLAPCLASAQTAFNPYYGKNQIRYDKFDWQIYETEHFEIFYYPEIEEHLERIAGYAESAYLHISGELKHDLAFKVSLILFKTSSEFQQQNVIPGAAQEGVGAFAEPMRTRIVMPLDDPPDLLYRLIVHELTHQFEFDIVPGSLLRRDTPLWVNEGLSDYMTATWRPIDLMMVRDAAVADIVPRMSELEGYTNIGSVRLVYNLGHAAFEFMESRWGKEGIRQYMFALRNSVIGGGQDAYQEAFRISPEEFDDAFDKYLKDRFIAYRDKERPADYGRNLAPNPQRSHFTNAISIEASPSGDLVAMVTGNRRDYETDIVLISSDDGSVVRHLTNGFDQDRGYEFIVQPGMRFNTVPWLSWSPSGDQIGYFVRAEKSRTLILQNVLSRNVDKRIALDTVDDPESPDISPDGRKVTFAALRDGVGDLFLVDLDTEDVTNLTNDGFADSGPTWSPDGQSIIYVSRISGSEKLFRLDVATGQKTQITFGTHDDSAAQFMNADTIVFSSTATDPTEPTPIEEAANGNVYNIWTLSLTTGELRQYTDTLGGNTSVIVLNQGSGEPRIAFVGYYKGNYELHVLDRPDPIVTASSEDFGGPGPIVDFQAPMSHTLISTNSRRKGTFEKMYLDGRPPLNLGVTSGGDIFGGSAVTISDVLGDKQFSVFAASISQYRTYSASYVNLARRFNYAIQAYSQTQFFYGQYGGIFYDPAFSNIIDRDLAMATRTLRGATVFGIWPLNRYRRFEVTAGVVQFNERFNDSALAEASNNFQSAQFGRQIFQNGTFMPLGLTYVQETTVFREFGPLSGDTMRLSYEFAPPIGNSLSRHTADLDIRYYQRLYGTGLLALRAKGFKSWGNVPTFNYFGGNSEMRGYEYLQFIGSETAFFNAELRFPIIVAMLTPIGAFGGVRGTLFANMGGAKFDSQPFQWWSNSPEKISPVIGSASMLLTPEQILGPPAEVNGFRLVNARASYGLGLETFALGFPIHVDWAWRTLLNQDWEDVLFAATGGSAEFRKPQFSVWIGYDF